MKNAPRNLSIIDKDLSIEGTIKSKGNLVIKGVVKGTLEGETVVIADKGAVAADAQVLSMTIGGSFDGEIRASQELIILSTGSCTGRVICKDLSVERGGVLNASVRYISSQEDFKVEEPMILKEKL